MLSATRSEPAKAQLAYYFELTSSTLEKNCCQKIVKIALANSCHNNEIITIIINLIRPRLRDMDTIHGQHLEMIDLSGRLLGRLWHGYQLELFDRVFFFVSFVSFFF